MVEVGYVFCFFLFLFCCFTEQGIIFFFKASRGLRQADPHLIYSVIDMVVLNKTLKDSRDLEMFRGFLRWETRWKQKR